MPKPASPGTLGVQPIKALLSEAKVTQEAVGRSVGLSDGQVTRVVNGQSRPSPQVAAGMARLVGRPVEDCFTPHALAPVKPAARRRSDGPSGVHGFQPVRWLFEAAGISDSSAAKTLGCSAEFVNRAVNGKSRPSLVVAARMARLVEKPIDACFTLDGVVADPAFAAPRRHGLQPLAALLAADSAGPVDVAEALYLSPKFIEEVLSGRTRLSLEHATLLARLVGRPIEECFTDALLGIDETCQPLSIAEPTEVMLRRLSHPAQPGPYGVQPAKELLFSRGITHEHIGDVIGCTQQHVTAFVNGQTRPSVVLAARLAQALGTSIEECLTLGDIVPTVPRRGPGPYGVQPVRTFLEAEAVPPATAAGKAGITLSFLARVLNGDSRPQLQGAALLARLVGRSIEECFTEETLGLTGVAMANRPKPSPSSGRPAVEEADVGTSPPLARGRHSIPANRVPRASATRAAQIDLPK